MNNICAVVVTYNRIDMLKECVCCLLGQQGASCDVLIIDNASTDGTEKTIDPLIDGSRVKYYNTGANLGGAGGFRIGMEQAVLYGYKYIWLMDDDTYVYAESLRTLLEADRSLDGRYGFLSSIADWKDGTPCNMNRQYVAVGRKITDYANDVVQVYMASFVSFFIKSEIVRQAGLPIKEFFTWADDLEYSRRISMKYPCYAVNTSHVLHNMESNHKVGIEAEGPERLWRYEYLYRNEVYIYRREGAKGRLYLLARVALHSARVILYGTDKRRKLSVIWKSYTCGFRFSPEIEYVKECEAPDVSKSALKGELANENSGFEKAGN